MHNRFERIIAAAVMTGAVTLAGCASSGGGGGGTPGDSDVEFWGAHAVAKNQIELYFSDGIQLPSDTAAAAGLFSLRANQLSYGIRPQSPVCIGTTSSSGGNSYYCTSTAAKSNSFTTFYTIGSNGREIGQGADVSLDPDDDTRVILTIDGTIQSSDAKLGLLRLSYSGGTDGLQDAAGDVIQEVALTTKVLGNVAASANLGPRMVSAKTVDSTHVKLTFNEPVSIPDGKTAAAASHFTLHPMCRLWDSTNHSTFTGTSGQSTYWSFHSAGNVYSASLTVFPPGSYYERVGSKASIPDVAPYTLVLTVPSMPTNTDPLGRFQLSYTKGSTGDIEGPTGKVMQDFSLSSGHPGFLRNLLTTISTCTM